MTAPAPQSQQISGQAINTDREIYHTPLGSVYDDSIHVTHGGGIGINVGGHVIVKPLRDWHALASGDVRAAVIEAHQLNQLSLLTAAGYNAEKVHPFCYNDFSHVKFTEGVIAALSQSPATDAAGGSNG